MYVSDDGCVRHIPRTKIQLRKYNSYYRERLITGLALLLLDLAERENTATLERVQNLNTFSYVGQNFENPIDTLQCNAYIDRTCGLSSKMALWLYKCVIIPKITYRLIFSAYNTPWWKNLCFYFNLNMMNP